MLMKYKNIDIITLRSAHCLIMGNKPSLITAEGIDKKLLEDPPELESFGLFDSAQPNYNTYYPDLDLADLQPKDDEFIFPVFRMLSMVTVHKGWYPVSFSKPGVLKASMALAKGITINIDHEMMVGNAIGSTFDIFWQNAYTDKNGVKVPAGINGVFKIDGKANPKIARGIQMDPPSIHSDSVTVKFAWEQSHPKLSGEDFRDKMGTEVDGKMVERVATDILMYAEVSLVGMGADPFAQVNDGNGKIVNPQVAARRYYQSFGADLTEFNSRIYNMDWKTQTETLQFSVDGNNTNFNNTNFNNTNMDYSEILNGLGITFNGEITSEAQFTDAVKVHLTALKNKSKPSSWEAIASTSEGLTPEQAIAKLAEHANYEALGKLEEITPIIAIGKNHLAEVRVKAINSYKLLTVESKQDASHIETLENADLATVTAFNTTYEAQLAEKLPLTCQDCDSTNISRKTSIEDDPNAGSNTFKAKSPQEVANSIRDKNAMPNTELLHGNSEIK